MNNRIVVAVGKPIVAEKTLSSGGKDVCIDEAADGGVVVTALQVVEPGFSGGAVAGMVCPEIL